MAEPSTPVDNPPSCPQPTGESSLSQSEQLRIVKSVISNNCLYDILGVPKAPTIDKMTLRRAYLARSKACHPEYVIFLCPAPRLSAQSPGSKFPDNPDATQAFQKVAVAYDVLSKPSLKRIYDTRAPDSTYDVFAAHPAAHAEETFKGVILGVFNDFLEGDLEMIRTLLSGCSGA